MIKTNRINKNKPVIKKKKCKYQKEETKHIKWKGKNCKQSKI